MDSQVFVYSATQVCQLLNISNTCSVPMPEASSLKPEEVLLWYPGLTLTQLRGSPLGKERMWQNQDWYDRRNFSAEPGYYAVQIRIPDSNRKNLLEQQALQSKSKVSPAAVAALALLVHLKETGDDLLQDGWCRCADFARQGYCVVLTVYNCRVSVRNDWDGDRFGDLWLAAARKI